jgi:hypothetical protein
MTMLTSIRQMKVEVLIICSPFKCKGSEPVVWWLYNYLTVQYNLKAVITDMNIISMNIYTIPIWNSLKCSY